MQGSSSSCGAPLGGVGEFQQRAEPAPGLGETSPAESGREEVVGKPLRACEGNGQLGALVCLGSLGPSVGHS